MPQLDFTTHSGLKWILLAVSAAYLLFRFVLAAPTWTMTRLQLNANTNKYSIDAGPSAVSAPPTRAMLRSHIAALQLKHIQLQSEWVQYLLYSGTQMSYENPFVARFRQILQIVVSPRRWFYLSLFLAILAYLMYPLWQIILRAGFTSVEVGGEFPIVDDLSTFLSPLTNPPEQGTPVGSQLGVLLGVRAASVEIGPVLDVSNTCKAARAALQGLSQGGTAGLAKAVVQPQVQAVLQSRCNEPKTGYVAGLAKAFSDAMKNASESEKASGSFYIYGRGLDDTRTVKAALGQIPHMVSVQSSTGDYVVPGLHAAQGTVDKTVNLERQKVDRVTCDPTTGKALKPYQFTTKAPRMGDFPIDERQVFSDEDVRIADRQRKSDPHSDNRKQRLTGVFRKDTATTRVHAETTLQVLVYKGPPL